MKTSEYKDLKFASGKPQHCWICKAGLTRASATVDHLKPKSRGGRNSKENYRLACAECNGARGNIPLTPQEWAQATGRFYVKRRDYSNLVSGIAATRNRGT